MRAMIVAAGLGTRLRPLTDLRAKPALPVRGIPVIHYTLALLARHGVREVVVNLHHLSEGLAETARSGCPENLALHFSHEPQLLDTGGGIRKVAEFLRGSDPCLVVGGDMLLDVDLGALVAHHRARDAAATMLLREDPRADHFGTIGVDEEGCVRRIARRFDLGAETRAGIYAWANVFSPRVFDSLPDREIFSHLDGWLTPQLASGARDILGYVTDPGECTWEPVGTLPEYLAVNLRPPSFTPFDADARARAQGVRFDPELVVGAGARIGPGARLTRAVVWDGEQVPAGFQGEDGIFAGGAFHRVPAVGDAGG